jgi:prepilin peptidase dependent protein B
MLIIPRLASQGRARGFTLVELMIGIVVGLIVLAGVIAVFLSVVRGSVYVAREARLNQDLRTAMDLMVNDIRRAGYWRDAIPFDPTTVDADTIQHNPFMNRVPGDDDVRDIHILLNDRSCIVFSYDTQDAGGESGVVFGYRLNGGEIQTLLDPTVVATTDCGTGSWQSITDSRQVAVETLTFDLAGSRCLNVTASQSWQGNEAGTVIPACIDEDAVGYEATDGDILIESRRININMVGRHAADANTQLALSESITVRNNRIFAFFAATGGT